MSTKESKAFENPEAHPLILYLLCLKHLESTWQTWISETILSEIERVFSTKVTPNNFNKILAAKTLYISDTFWEHWEVFKNMVLALDGKPLSLQTIHAPNTASLMNAIEIANIVKKQEFNEEIARFTAACLLNDDVHYAPGCLNFCQLYITQPTYKCKDCEKIGSALPPFKGMCDVCSEMFKGPKAFNFKPKIDAGWNVTYSLTYDPEPIKKRFEELAKEESPFIKETPEDIQCAKLLIAKGYADLKLKEFRDQCRELNLKS
jgi:hypothetical protein